MSSFPLFPASVPRRPVTAAWKSPAGVFEHLSALPKPVEVIPASRLAVRLAPEMVASGVAAIDLLTGGLPRGCLTEICGTASSGRTSFLLAVLAAATRREEACALVDVSDSFDPASAVKTEVDFKKLLWVRCGVPKKNRSDFKNRGLEDKKRNVSETPAEQALRVTDLLLQSGGFGLVVMDLGDVSLKIARRIPLTSWFRFQRAVEHTSTVLLVITQAPCAQTCAALLMKVQARSLVKKPSISFQLSETTSHAQLLDGLHVQGELLRSRLERKPAGSVTAFETRATQIS